MNEPGGRPLGRRQVLRGAAGALGAVGLTAAGCGDVTPSESGAGGKVKVTMFVFLGGDLGVMPKEFAKEYEQSHRNVQIDIYEQSNTVGYPKMLAARQADPDKPLVNLGFFNAQTTEQGKLDDMWNQLDYDAMPNATDVIDQFKRDDRTGIGIGSDQIGLLYNTDEVAQAPGSWTALWDDAFRGKVVLFKNPWFVVFMAAKLNGGSEQDMDPGFALWQENAKQIRTMVSSNPQYLNVLANGTGTLTAYFNGTGNQWVRGGAPLAYSPPSEGAISVPVYLQSAAGSTSEQQEVSQDIINEMLSPRWCGRWAETSIEVPANAKATLPGDLAGLPAFSQQTVENFVQLDWATVGRNTADWAKRWEREVESRI